MRQYDFVKQVYYLQEKVLLDFWPTDDKYQEVIYEANLVLQELQKEEDWSWLRKQVVLGPLSCKAGDIPEFELPEWVYKPSTLHKDCVHLHRPDPHSETGYDQHHWIEVPYSSIGMAAAHTHVQQDGFVSNGFDNSLRAVLVGRTLTFTRPPAFGERCMIAVADMQSRIPLMRTLEEVTPEHAQELANDEVLIEIPDPNYVVTRTAALHAEGSPPAQARAMNLADQAQKLLSAMRANDAAATDSDTIEWSVPSYVEMI